MNTDRRAVLLVEPERSLALALSAELRKSGHSVEVMSDGRAALSSLKRTQPDLVLSELRVPQISGIALLSRSKERWPSLPFILMAAVHDMSSISERVRSSADRVLMHPSEPKAIIDGILEVVRDVLEHSPSERRGHDLENIILGGSACMANVRRYVREAVASGLNVLVLGETGSGKELVVRSIHQLSGVRDKQLIVHNCAATPAMLAESCFFGHVRGAFTSAHGDYSGLLKEADGSNLFLDEVAELPPGIQAKLLRVMEGGDFRPVGSNEVQTVSVRLIAATNRDLSRMLARKRLRRDFYERLSGFEIHLPPLRERLEDIPLLASHFLESQEVLSAETMSLLQAHPWPGNVRELRKVLLRSRAVAGDAGAEVIQPEHVSFSSMGTTPDDPPQGPLTRVLPLAETIRRAVRDAIERTRGDRTHAAKLLGISRSTLRRWIGKLEAGEEDISRHSGKPSRRSGPK